MSESYVEVMVKKERTLMGKLLSLIVTFLIIFSIVLFVLSMNPIIMIFTILFGVAMYFVRMNTNLEFEYLYVDKELTIDKIMAKTKRKKVTKISMERLEVIAPIGSYHLDDYKNRLDKTPDYSSGRADAKRFLLVYEGQRSVIIEPGDELLRMIKNIAPRKVFTD
ncbi:MAG: DUF6106 family protein [Clostridium sp.]|nr:DUF6106 family protein [Clostridium sp.]